MDPIAYYYSMINEPIFQLSNILLSLPTLHINLGIMKQFTGAIQKMVTVSGTWVRKCLKRNLTKGNLCGHRSEM